MKNLNNIVEDLRDKSNHHESTRPSSLDNVTAKFLLETKIVLENDGKMTISLQRFLGEFIIPLLDGRYARR